MRSKGFKLGTLKRNAGAIAVYDELIKKFGDATEPGVRGQVATAMRAKGSVLSKLKRSEEEVRL